MLLRRQKRKSAKPIVAFILQKMKRRISPKVFVYAKIRSNWMKSRRVQFQIPWPKNLQSKGIIIQKLREQVHTIVYGYYQPPLMWISFTPAVTWNFFFLIFLTPPLLRLSTWFVNRCVIIYNMHLSKYLGLGILFLENFNIYKKNSTAFNFRVQALWS